MWTKKVLCRLIFCFLLLEFFIDGQSQPTSLYPFAQDIIKFDLLTHRADKPIPFDKPFLLLVDNINTENIIRVSLYRAKTKAGNHELFPDRGQDSYTDYVFGRTEMIVEKTKLTLKVPALKPSMDFDILIQRKLLGSNLEKAHALDKIIVDNNLDPTQPGFTWPNEALKAFRVLKDSANNQNFNPARTVFGASTISAYYNIAYLKYADKYKNITDDTKFATVAGSGVSFIGTSELLAISTQGPANARPFNDAYLLERIVKENVVDPILLGMRPVGYQLGAKITERDEFEKRMANLNASILFFDSLYRTTSEMAARNSTYDNARDEVMKFLQALQSNKKVIADNLKGITAVRAGLGEAVWLIGTTQSRDLQTKSSSIFTLDAGFANIWARDLNNNFSYIPKLYWGVNIYFRGTDKNIRARYIPVKRKPELIESEGDSVYCDFDILTRKTMFTHLCLTIGFTFGSLDKQNFDNFFAGSSMLVGPSVRLTRSFRISAGAAFLKRANENPLLSEKRITVGSYLSASLDLDILNAIKNATNLFFK